MRAHEIILKPKGDNIQIFVISCLHIGHAGYDEQKALDYRDYILRTPNTYAISLGDDTENALPGDERHNSMMWDQNMTPAEQFQGALDYWEPVVKAGKLLLTQDSNHWWRSEAKTGVSQAAQMNIFLNNMLKGTKKEKTGPRWGRWMSFLKLHVGPQIYTIHSWHGAGGGSTPESALKKCRTQADSHHADVYLMGHHHKKLVYEDAYWAWPKGHNNPIERKRAYGVTGCFLNWNESYAERAGLPPAVRGAIRVQLGIKRWDVKVSL